jgi:hypothetical protein
MVIVFYLLLLIVQKLIIVDYPLTSFQKKEGIEIKKSPLIW